MSKLSITKQTITVVSEYTLDNATKIYTGDKEIPGVELTLSIERHEAAEILRTLQDMLLQPAMGIVPPPLKIKLYGVISSTDNEP